MAELNFTIRWQSTGEFTREGHVGEPYGGLRKKYRYRYFITGHGRPPLRWVAQCRGLKDPILGRSETLSEAKAICQKHWESQPENPMHVVQLAKATEPKTVTKVVERHETAGMGHGFKVIPCGNALMIGTPEEMAAKPSGAVGDFEKKHAIVKVNEAIRKLNSIEWSHRNLQINDIDLAKANAYKALESLRHVLKFYNGL